MNPTIKELIEQHSNLRLDNAENRKILIDTLAAAWKEEVDGYYNDGHNDGYEDGYSEGQSECE